MTAQQTEIPSATRIPVKGWFITNPVKLTSVEVTLVEKYEWKQAVRLEDNSGNEIITTPDRFASEKPETACQKAEREKRELERSTIAKEILDALGSERMSLSDLARKMSVVPLAIINRVNNWTELMDVKVERTPRGIMLWNVNNKA